MNRIAGRSMVVMVLVLFLVGGIGFFAAEFAFEAQDWVLFPGSPHIYNGTKMGSGYITDRAGNVLLNLDGNRVYAQEESVRKAMLHWLGDRDGFISAPAMTHYAQAMSGYDLLNGVYRYGDLGGTTQLTLSASVQAAALQAMEGKVGTIAVYNYKTGEILCALSTPNYDPDHVPDIAGDTTGAYEGVYLNRFTQSAYIPGSIYKIVTLAAALETVAGIQDMRFECEGETMIEHSIITCTGKHGSQDLESAFANSCNVAFAEIALLVGEENLEYYADKFRINDSLAFDGIVTAEGNLQIADGSKLELAWSGIGQGKDQVNACAFMNFVGAIASGGQGMLPYVVQSVSVEQEQTYAAAEKQSGRIMSQTTAQILTGYMRNNVQTRYGDEHFPGLTVCAKSGTGEVGGGKKPNATFAGFVMDEEYPLAFIVIIENGGSGSYVCAPVLGPVLQACKQMMDAS